VIGSATEIVVAVGFAHVSVAVYFPVPNAAAPVRARATEAPATGASFVTVTVKLPSASVV
jgi:hypothetical protein